VATSRAKSKKRRKKKGTKARWPAIFLIIVFVAAGLLLINQVNQSPSSNTTPIAIGDNTIVSGVDDSSAPINTDASGPSGTDPSNLGKPVIVHSDTLGDLDVDQVIDDWTGVDPPSLPDEFSLVGSAPLEGEYLANDLLDGIYVGYLVTALDDNEQGFAFDIRDSPDNQLPHNEGLRLYPAYLDSILFVSLSTSGEANTAITVAKYFELALSNTSELQIPNTDLTAKVTQVPMLLTVVDGEIIAIEGIDS
jgi:hypothetical protein